MMSLPNNVWNINISHCILDLSHPVLSLSFIVLMFGSVDAGMIRAGLSYVRIQVSLMFWGDSKILVATWRSVSYVVTLLPLFFSSAFLVKLFCVEVLKPFCFYIFSYCGSVISVVVHLRIEVARWTLETNFSVVTFLHRYRGPQRQTGWYIFTSSPWSVMIRFEKVKVRSLCVKDIS